MYLIDYTKRKSQRQQKAPQSALLIVAAPSNCLAIFISLASYIHMCRICCMYVCIDSEIDRVQQQ